MLFTKMLFIKPILVSPILTTFYGGVALDAPSHQTLAPIGLEVYKAVLESSHKIMGDVV